MSLGGKISQIAKLSELQPDKRWETTTKYDLLAEISSQNRMMQAQKLTNTEKTDLVFMRIMNKVAPSFTRAVAAFLIIMMGSGVSMAAQASVPGQALWPIKRSMEKVELSLAISPVTETEMHIKHAGKRLQEIDKILQETNTQPAKVVKKEKAIKQAVRHLEKDVTSADISLKIAKEEKKPIEVVELAKKVTDVTKEVTVVLDEKSGEATDKNIEEALDSIKEVNKEVQKSAVNVALAVHEEVLALVKQKEDKNNLGQASTTEDGLVEVMENSRDPLNIVETTEDMNHDTTTVNMIVGKSAPEIIDLEINDEEIEAVKNLVKEMVASEIDNTSSEIAGVKEKAGTVAQEDIENFKKDTALTDTEEEDLVSIDTLQAGPEKVNQTLQEVKVLMEDGFLRDAFEKISQVKEEYQKAGIILKKIEEAIANHKIIDEEVIKQLESLNNFEATPLSEQGNIEASSVIEPQKIKESEVGVSEVVK